MNDEPTFDHLETHCLFCDPMKHGQYQQVLLRSDNFYLFAGLGAIVDGYIIIAPYICDDSEHRIRSLSELPKDWMDELSFLRSIVAEFYQKCYSSEMLAFEHGRAGTCSMSTSGTQHCFHAHLCCYPFPSLAASRNDQRSTADLGSDDTPLWRDVVGGQALPFRDLHELPTVVGGSPYLLVERTKTNTANPSQRRTWEHKVFVLSDEEQLEGQYSRRLLANRVDDAESWDWRSQPRLAAARRVGKKFRNYLRSRETRLGVEWNGKVANVSFFDSVASSNEFGNDANSHDFSVLWSKRLNHRALGAFLERLKYVPTNGSSDRKVLDGGCGPGNYLATFYYHGIECVGIDTSSLMLKIAQSEIDSLDPIPTFSEPPPLPRLKCQDAATPNFLPGSFHGIWYSAVAVHIPRAQLRLTLEKLREILVPGGVLYLSIRLDESTNERVTVRSDGRVFFHHNEEELRQLFFDAGLDVLDEWQETSKLGSSGSTEAKTWHEFIVGRTTKEILPSKGYDTLGDLGEEAIRDQILKRLSSESKSHANVAPADDCAVLDVAKNELVVASTDACPTPVLSIFEGTDFRRLGWFAMAIGLSDLAAMGARPMGMLLALEAEQSMKLADLDEFYDGVLEASHIFKCPVVGGNIKDSNSFNCVGTALGSVPPNEMMRSTSARPGERVFVLEESGRYWPGTLCQLENIQLPVEQMEFLLEPLRRPWPRVREGIALARNKFSNCAMDSSDGLTACFSSIASNSVVDINIDLELLNVHPNVANVARICGVDPKKLMLSWGDWQFVCTISDEDVPRLYETMAELNCPVTEVDWVSKGNGQVWVHDRTGRLGEISDFASTRFSKSSYFTNGLASFVGWLRNQPIFLEGEG